MKTKIWIIAVAFVACALLDFLGTKLFVTPTYAATTRIYVMDQAQENTVVYPDFQVAAQFVAGLYLYR